MVSATTKKYIAAVVDLAMRPEIRRATKFVSPTLTIKATRVGRWDKRARYVALKVSIGVPNYTERRQIRALRKAKEPFPVRKIYLNHPVRKRA